MSLSLTIRSHFFTLADLSAWSTTSALSDLSDNNRQALAICHDWLSGATEFVVRTSGSTGDPKPITLRREQMVASAHATGAALGLRPGCRALVCLPTGYIAGRMMLVRGLVLDMAMTVVEPSNDPFASLPSGARFDFTAVVPMQLQTLLDGPPHYLDRLNAMQAILVGGSPVSAPLEERVRTLDAPVYHTYGMTETVTHVALRQLNGAEASTAFRPLPGVELGSDDRGCLRVSGPMTLYQWVQTNDLVELQIDGSFRWLGRWDTVINTGGVKVQVEQVELQLGEALRSLGLGERRFFVGPLPDERLGQVVAVILEGEPLGVATETAILSVLHDRLNRFALPRRFVYLPSLAETPTGKIDRQANLRRGERLNQTPPGSKTWGRSIP